jgi:phospholipase/carboxylesterase
MKRIVFLHGVGSSGANMRPLAQALDLSVPAHCPDGPHPFDMGPGRQWFSVRGISEANRPDRVAAALPALTALLQSLGPTGETLLIGFSQGSIMALHAAAAGLPLAGVIAIAGRLAGPVPARTTWPPITLLNGALDPIMPPSIANATAEWLRDAAASPKAQIFQGLGHMIDDQVIAAIRTQLAAFA